uniref:L-diaminobutyric acid transaminase n=1 Tax=Halomonas sp. BYS-1 TaxID=179977 RepID=Q4U323_9GAMM|nr:L-diaminobutyric acid transaminase [Halomonas sp. BYS-1]
MSTPIIPFTPSADLARPTVADAVVGHASTPLFIRKPNADDGWGIYELIKACPPLDVNSAYAYLLLATQFRDTCAVATNEEGEIVGFVSLLKTMRRTRTFYGRLPLVKKHVVLAWHAVYVEAIMSRPELDNVHHLETTITPTIRPLGVYFAASLPVGKPRYTAENIPLPNNSVGSMILKTYVRIGPFQTDSM